MLNGGGGRNRTGVHGFAVRCMATLPPRRAVTCTADHLLATNNAAFVRTGRTVRSLGPRQQSSPVEAEVHEKGKPFRLPRLRSGAGNESRTRDLNLGKVALYQLSYSRTVGGDYSLPGGARNAAAAVNGARPSAARPASGSTASTRPSGPRPRRAARDQ